MALIVPTDLPAIDFLKSENIRIKPYQVDEYPDQEPLRILIVNLMPTKMTTELQFLRLLSNSSQTIQVEFLQMKSHISRNTSTAYLDRFYLTTNDIAHATYDGMIITGAPVEQLAFEEVNYWQELCQVMEWSKTHVTSILHVCWGAQAGLYYHYGVPKYPLSKKMFGIYEHDCLKPNHPLMRGFDSAFLAPHSRHTEIRQADLQANPGFEILSVSSEAGVYLLIHKETNQIFVTGHCEYDRDTLKNEYDRDISKGKQIQIPCRYFPNDDVRQSPDHSWRSHSSLLFMNWITYYVKPIRF